ncbi:unnamed protein product [Calicophoron daubneyi]|uniref:Ion transport domain-containing protein n=1 Tax=Calicophoron daubneyi TaxID=300641 RepID=A0AAV2SZD3_CALDB
MEQYQDEGADDSRNDATDSCNDPIDLLSSEVNVNALLHKYSRQGEAEKIRLLLKKYPQTIKDCINQRDSADLAALHYAARHGNLSCVRVLVEEGFADVNVKTKKNTTPLHFAARFRRETGASVFESERIQINHAPMRTESFSYADRTSASSRRISRVKKFLSVDLQDKRSQANNGYPSGAAAPIYDPVIHYLVEHGAKLNENDANGWSALHYAAVRGNEVAARQLLHEPNIDTENCDHDLMRPIHLAAAHGELEVARLLLGAGAIPNALDVRRSLPLHFACATGDLKLIKLLLAASKEVGDGSPLGQVNSNRETPFHWAVLNGHAEAAQYCIANGVDPNTILATGETSLHIAAKVGSLSTVRVLLSAGTNIDTEDKLLQTALHKAADRDNLEVVRLLVKQGADLENQDRDGNTPLLLASSQGHVQLVKALIDAGANLRAQEKNAKSAVYICAEENRHELLEVLLACPLGKSLIPVPDIFNDTPLHVAAKRGHLEIVKLLIKAGVDLSVKNERERTALHYAARNGRLPVARLLLDHAPGLISERDEDGNTAIHLAADNGHQAITELLLMAGATVDSPNTEKWTPLDCAAANGHRSCAEILLKNGSPVDPLDVSNTTPLHLACKNGHADMVDLLLSWGANPAIRMRLGENAPACGPNALDVAIDNGQKSCALALLRSSHWENTLRNQTVGWDGNILTPMRKLIAKMPDIAEIVLDQCITVQQKNEDTDGNEVEKEVYNFEFLEDTYAQWSPYTILCQKQVGLAADPFAYLSAKYSQFKQYPWKYTFFHQNRKDKRLAQFEVDVVKIDPARPYTKNNRVLKNNHPLMLMVKFDRPRLLEHKLVGNLIAQKWTPAGLVYFLNLTLYLIYLLVYTTYMLSMQSLSMALYDRVNITGMPPNETCTHLSSTNFLREPSYTILLCKYAIFSFATGHLCKEIFQLIYSGYQYFSLENLMECSIFILAILSVGDFQDCVERFAIKQDWQWQCGAVGIFLAWLNLLLFLRRIPTLGIFVLMFTVILRTFSKFFIVFFLFILAFAFGFHILLSNHMAFNSLSNSLLKSAVMMLGELEFDSTFNQRFTSADRSDMVFFEGLTYGLFVTFLIIMTIVIMNLLVGLAVDDIKGVQNQAVVKRIAMQIELILDVDSLLPHRLRKRLTKMQFVKKKYRPNSRRAFRSRRLLNQIRSNFDLAEKESKNRRKRKPLGLLIV